MQDFYASLFNFVHRSTTSLHVSTVVGHGRVSSASPPRHSLMSPCYRSLPRLSLVKREVRLGADYVHLMDMYLMGVHLIGMHLIGVCFMDVHFTGVHPTGVHLRRVHHECASHGRVSHERAYYRRAHHR